MLPASAHEGLVENHAQCKRRRRLAGVWDAGPHPHGRPVCPCPRAAERLLLRRSGWVVSTGVDFLQTRTYGQEKVVFPPENEYRLLVPCPVVSRILAKSQQKLRTNGPGE